MKHAIVKQINFKDKAVEITFAVFDDDVFLFNFRDTIEPDAWRSSFVTVGSDLAVTQVQEDLKEAVVWLPVHVSFSPDQYVSYVEASLDLLNSLDSEVAYE